MCGGGGVGFRGMCRVYGVGWGQCLGKTLQFDLQKKKMGQMVGKCNPPLAVCGGCWVGFRCVEGVSGGRNLCIHM